MAAGICEGRRRWGGASGFARYIMRLEGKTMDAAMMLLIHQGITMLPLCDGILVPQPNIDQAVFALKQASKELLGFIPRVRQK